MAAGFEVVEGKCKSEDDLIELLNDADAAQVGVMPLAQGVAGHPVKGVSRMGVGVDSIDLDAATELGVLAYGVPGVNTAEVADRDCHELVNPNFMTVCAH